MNAKLTELQDRCVNMLLDNSTIDTIVKEFIGWILKEYIPNVKDDDIPP
jgi:hypothetical protein